SPLIDTTSGSPTINNFGALTLSGAGTTVKPTLNNGGGGTINLPTSGLSLSLLGGGAHAGTFAFGASGSQITLNGPHTFNSGSGVTGPSTFNLIGGVLTVNNNVTIATFNLSGGILTGATNTLSVTSVLNWTGGTISGGNLQLFSGATANLNSVAGL